METKFKITIPEPCHENWNKMTPEETGRFCSVCTKGVIDFTTKSDQEIQIYLQENKDKKLCGRFRNDQINKFDIQIPQSLLRQPMPFQKAFLLMLFIAMGSSLFSCKNHNDETLGDVVVVEDRVETCHTTGVILSSKESNLKQKTNTTVGDAKYNPNNSKQIPPPPPKLDRVKFTKGEKHSNTAANETEVYTAGIISIAPQVLEIEKPTCVDSIKK